MEKNVDVEGLRQLHQRDKCARALFNHLANRRNNASVTNVDRLLAIIIGNERTPVTRQELIHVLQQLEQLGCGRFIPGRHSKPSRFEWTVEITSVGKAAKGEAVAIPQSESIEVDEGDADPSDINQIIPDNVYSRGSSARIAHSYRLRPEFSVSFELPADLSAKEATRLADFIRTLPFEH
jgi:hypothetical protein